MKAPTRFNGFGKPVPSNRQQAGYNFVKTLFNDISTNELYALISRVSMWILKDEPFRIVGQVIADDETLNRIDITGRYRLLAILLTEPQ